MTTNPSAILPFHTYLWKVASRCNLNCSYCYVYNRADDRWREQPALMSTAVATRIAQRMREHLEAHGKRDASIVFHGGEPMIGGVAHLRELTSVIGEVFHGSDVRLNVGMQSNLLLFDEDIGDLMLARGMTVGTSIDGPPRINDRYRVDHRGRPSSAQLADKLRLLTSPRYRPLFSGFLCVIDVTADPIEVIDYLLGYEPPGIDLLLPLDNHDRRPPGKAGARFLDTPYADWLIKAFDHWESRAPTTKIRYFNSIIQLLCGAPSMVESVGLTPVDIVVVETNGDIEAVDSLKATYSGATRLGYSVFTEAFDTVAADLGVRSRQLGADTLCAKCRACPVVHACGAGYLPHRYSAANGFDNPSVYCTDLEKLVRHIHAVVEGRLTSLRVAT